MLKPSKRSVYTLLGLFLTIICCFIFEGRPLIKETSAPAEKISLPILRYEAVTATGKGSKNSVTREAFLADITALMEEGCTFINSDDLVLFAMGAGELPEKPIWLTFDGGHESFYTMVYPILQEKNIKADVNIVGSYTDLYSDQLELRDTGCLSWMQAAELDASPLVAVGNMSYDLNEQKLFGRKGASIKPKEEFSDYRALLCADVLALQGKMNERLSHDSRVFCYPHGAYCKESEQILTEELGFLITLTRDEGMNELSDKSSLQLLKRFSRDGRKSTEEFLKKILEY